MADGSSLVPQINVLGSAQAGLQLGSSVKGLFDQREQLQLDRDQQQLLGGLRRRSLGLGGGSEAEQQEAQLQLLSADPKAAGAFFDSFRKLPTPEQDRIKLQQQRIGTAASNILQLPDNQLSMGLLQTAKAFQNSGDSVSAQRTMQLAQEGLEPNELRARLSAIETQSRDQEKVIASGEKREATLSKQSEADLNNELKQEKQKFEQIDKLRGRVDGASKTFKLVNSANNRVKAALDIDDETIKDFSARFQAANPEQFEKFKGNVKAFGDLALIFNFMKMLDPGSTVREGEFANAQNTGGIPDRVVNLYQNVLSGARLNEAQRNAIRLQSSSQFKAAQKQNIKDTAKFRRSAEKFNLPMDQIFDVVTEDEVEPQIQGTEGANLSGLTDEQIRQALQRDG